MIKVPYFYSFFFHTGLYAVNENGYCCSGNRLNMFFKNFQIQEWDRQVREATAIAIKDYVTVTGIISTLFL